MSKKPKVERSGPRVLFIDIETAPMLAYVWGLFDQNVALNQVKSDWHLLSFSAKWADEKTVIYHDQRKAKNIEDDKELLKKIWVLLDEADIVIGQNIKKFDHKKINARFFAHDIKPPSSYKLIDTLSIAKKNFAFTSNKLEYMSSHFNEEYKKLSHSDFPGFALWTECLKGNPKAWASMEKYNRYDVLSLEELYNKLAPWDNSVNFGVYNDDIDHKCSCGHDKFRNKGYAYTSSGKFRRFQCLKCGKESRGKENLLTIEKRRSLRK